MRKIALLLVLFMVVAPVLGLCYPAAVDNVLDSKSKSDLHPVQDTARMASAINGGVNKVMDTEPMPTIMKPVHTVKDETLKGAYKVTNTLWDLITLRSFREKK